MPQYQRSTGRDLFIEVIAKLSGTLRVVVVLTLPHNHNRQFHADGTLSGEHEEHEGFTVHYNFICATEPLPLSEFDCEVVGRVRLFSNLAVLPFLIHTIPSQSQGLAYLTLSASSAVSKVRSAALVWGWRLAAVGSVWCRFMDLQEAERNSLHVSDRAAPHPIKQANEVDPSPLLYGHKALPFTVGEPRVTEQVPNPHPTSAPFLSSQCTQLIANSVPLY